MLKNSTRILVISMLLLFSGLSYGQVNSPGGVTCDDVGPICSDDSGSFVFQNNNDPTTNITSSIACLGDGPRPAWFFLKVDQTGNLEFDIIQIANAGGGLDVDFVCWGPFASELDNCDNLAEECVSATGLPIGCPNNTDNPTFYTNNLDNTNIIDCSYSAQTTERLTINNAVAGEYYLLLVTNFQGGNGTIEILQTNFGAGTSGSTDCSIINVDGILGADIDICDTGSASATLDANPENDPDFVDFSWEFDDGSGFVPLAGTDGQSSITVSNSGTYQVTIANSTGDSDTDIVEVFFREVPVANAIPPQEICDDNNDGFWTFDFENLETLVLNGQSASDFEITFHSSFDNADNDLGALPKDYTNQVAYEEESIFVRIENKLNTECYDITSFTIDVFEQPTALPYRYELCDDNSDGDDTNGLVEFNLSSINSEVLGSQDPMQFNVSYHFDQADADAGASLLSNVYTNAIANADQIVVRVENRDNSDCFDTALVDLVVNALPVITGSVDLVQCDDNSDGFSDFNLAEANSLISVNYENEVFSYYTTPGNANSANNEITDITSYTNLDPSSTADVLYARVENLNGCHRVAQLNLLVSATQIPPNLEILYEECDTGSVDDDITNGISTFDFSDAETQIRALSGLPSGQNLTFTYYETEADALAELNEISDVSNYRNEISPFEQEIYVRVDGDIDNSCVGLGVHVRLRTVNPTPNLDPPDIELCDDNSAGDLVEIFDLTQNENDIFNGDPNVNATYHLSYDDANDGIGAIADPNAYLNVNPTETIYVRVTNNATACYAIVDFDIMVNPVPGVSAAIPDFIECENNTDFVVDFDLESRTAEVLDGRDPMDYTVSYHASQIDADNLNSPLLSPYTNISNPQPIFVAITNTATGCSVSSLSFNIEVVEGADANSDGELLMYEICDEVGGNDGIAQFDLSTLNDEVYDGQNPAAFSLSYHDSFDNALNNVIPLPELYENSVNPQVIYARVSNNISPNECFAITEITLQVNLLPIISLEESYTLCLSSNGSEEVDIPPIIDTGLSASDYSFEWFLDGAALPGESGPRVTPAQSGTYSVFVTDISSSTVTMCMNSANTEVIESEPPMLEVELVSQAFADNHVIEAMATGIGDYEYSLDIGPWQDNGTFTNVSPGSHEVVARDRNGCGFASASIFVIDYPAYFTPNGDGNHDTWNIAGIGANAKIYIFDRYGKLLKQLNPLDSGWNGTFNGNKMPTSDYWFSVEYDEPLTGDRKKFRAHFTLKR